MNSNKRVIDASRGLPIAQMHYVPRQVYRQPVNVTVQPNANMVYRDPPKQVQATPVETEQPAPKEITTDTSMRGFDTTGSNINELYNKNADKIKIIPE